jgi:hypothetical protein
MVERTRSGIPARAYHRRRIRGRRRSDSEDWGGDRRGGGRHDGDDGVVLPGGVHVDFVEAFASGEGERRDDYELVVSWLSTSLKL